MGDGPTIAERAEHARRRLVVLDAIHTALEEPHTLLDLLLDAEDPDSAADAIVTRYGVDPIGARAVLDLLLQRLTAQPRRELEAQRDELLVELRRHEAP